MGFARIKGPLVSRIGQRVRYSTPKDVEGRGGQPALGIIEDEVWQDETLNSSPSRALGSDHDWGDYSFFAQLIRWDDGDYSIRLGYYRRRCGEDWWEFAGQTTISSDCLTIKSLLEKTLARTEWFAKDSHEWFAKGQSSGSR